MPGDDLNRFPTQSPSPVGSDLFGLLLFGTMSSLMGAAPRLPSAPHTPTTNFTIQQVCVHVYINTSIYKYMQELGGGVLEHGTFCCIH